MNLSYMYITRADETIDTIFPESFFGPIGGTTIQPVTQAGISVSVSVSLSLSLSLSLSFIYVSFIK